MTISRAHGHHTRATLTLATLATLATLGCASPAPAPVHWSAADERAVRAADSAYVAAWLRDDTTAVLGVLAPDAVLMPAGQRPLTTPSEIRAFWWPSDGSRTRILTFQRTIEGIGGAGDLAWTRSSDTLAFTYDKDTTHSQLGSRSMSLVVWRRQEDGSWRMSRAMWGPRKP